MHLYPRRPNVAVQVAGKLKSGHIRYPSSGGTQKERKRLCMHVFAWDTICHSVCVHVCVCACVCVTMFYVTLPVCLSDCVCAF